VFKYWIVIVPGVVRSQRALLDSTYALVDSVGGSGACDEIDVAPIAEQVPIDACNNNSSGFDWDSLFQTLIGASEDQVGSPAVLQVGAGSRLE